MVQPGIGDAVEAAIGLDGVGADRFFGQVGRGHHQDGEGRLGHCRVGREQQMVEGCVGHEHPEEAVAGRHGPGQARRTGFVRPGGCQHHRGLRGSQQGGGLRRQVGERGRHVGVADHHRERLGRAPLALPETLDGVGPGGVDGQVVAADSLDRDDAPTGQHAHRGGEGVVAEGRRPWLAGGAECQLRAACGAGRRLGVEPAVRGVLVLASTGGAEVEAGHRRGGAVVGQAGHDAEARAAVGAGDERVAVAAVGWVVQLGQARLAHRGVRRDRRDVAASPRVALDDREPDGSRRLQHLGCDPVDEGARRRVCPQPAFELFDGGTRAFRLDEDAIGVIADVAGHPEGSRHAVHEGAEPHALDHPGHPDADPCHGWGRHIECHRTTLLWSGSAIAGSLLAKQVRRDRPGCRLWPSWCTSRPGPLGCPGPAEQRATRNSGQPPAPSQAAHTFMTHGPLTPSGSAPCGRSR